MITNELIVYKNLKYAALIDEVYDLNSDIEGYAAYACSDDSGGDLLLSLKLRLKSIAAELIDFAYKYGFSGNLFSALIAFSLANNENPYSMSCEIRGDAGGSISEASLYDFEIIKKLLDINLENIISTLSEPKLSFLLDFHAGGGMGHIFNKRIRDRIEELARKLLRAQSSEQIQLYVAGFYSDFGVGKFGLHKAFRVENANVIPITNIQHVYLDDLVGYDIQKKMLVENTEAFINKKPCNNCLLYGEAGTGKSSSIKGILNKYYDRGLRIIELYKHQFKDLNDIISQIKSRNYRFIIYMDDLSFEDFEVEYKYLKAVIEGGLEKKPENVLIYATSNRRHLVKESFSDRSDYDDELHSSDTKQEKLSLYSRFGVTIYFPSPEKKEFNEIVKELARRHDLNMDDDTLIYEANKWEISHGGLSGRTAAQFISYILSRSDDI